MKKTLKTLSVVLCVILAFSAVSIGASAKAKKYVKSIKVTKKAAITIPASSSSAKKSFKVTVKTKGSASKKFTAKSSNGSIASVKVSGKKIVVTAKKAGTAKITVKTKGKNKKNKKLSAKLTVTVKKNKPASSSNNNNSGYVPPKPGTTPSTPSNPVKNLNSAYDTLRDMIKLYGSCDEDGDYYYKDSYSFGDTEFTCIIYYIVNENKFLFMSRNSMDNYDEDDEYYEGYCNFWTSMSLTYGGSSSTVAYWEGEKYDYDSWDDEYNEDKDWAFGSSATLIPASFSKNSNLYFSLYYGEASDDYINDYGNSDLQCSMVAWQYMLGDLDLDFSDLGFNNY